MVLDLIQTGVSRLSQPSVLLPLNYIAKIQKISVTAKHFSRNFQLIILNLLCIYTLTYLTERTLKENGFHRPELTERVRQTMMAILQLVEPIGISRAAKRNIAALET